MSSGDQNPAGGATDSLPGGGASWWKVGVRWAVGDTAETQGAERSPPLPLRPFPCPPHASREYGVLPQDPSPPSLPNTDTLFPLPVHFSIHIHVACRLFQKHGNPPHSQSPMSLPPGPGLGPQLPLSLSS